MHEIVSSDRRSALLRNAELFRELLDDDLGYFASRCGTVTAPPGETIFAAGSRADCFWVVESGTVVVERDGTIIARFGPGDVVGDFDFARGASRDATARSEEPTSLLVFPGDGRPLADLITERPDAAARLLLRSMAMISARIRSVQKLISENDPWVRELKRQSYTDANTGLSTRAYFDEKLAGGLEEPALFLLMKPDHFKELVDRYGHGAGDEAMSSIAELLSSTVRELGRGHAIRIKSNETALVIPRCDREEGIALACRLARNYASLELGDSCASTRITSSMALSFWPEHGAMASRLFDATYGLLQRAWRAGGAKVYIMRNRGGKPPEGLPERRGAARAGL